MWLMKVNVIGFWMWKITLILLTINYVTYFPIYSLSLTGCVLEKALSSLNLGSLYLVVNVVSGITWTSLSIDYRPSFQSSSKVPVIGHIVVVHRKKTMYFYSSVISQIQRIEEICIVSYNSLTVHAQSLIAIHFHRMYRIVRKISISLIDFVR